MRKSTFEGLKILSLGLNAALLLLAGCEGSHGSSSGALATDRPASALPTTPLPATPPAAQEGKPICIISADCPSGAHCDLGECVQDCNAGLPCDLGLACSQRARCVADEAEDVDPTPSVESKGIFTTTTSVSVLSEADTTLPITLSSSSKNAVDYRVQVEGAHLSVDSPRGKFTGTGQLTIKVDGSKLASADVPGTVRIFTDLGHIAVPADLHAGLDGFYRGALTYDNGPIHLGDARIRMALSKTSGGVLARVDPNASLLFPEDTTLGMAATTGYGTMSGPLLTLTITQRIPKAFGGARNHLGRDIGRQLTFLMKATVGGGWKGQFEERISGLFVQPVINTGTVILAYEGREGMTPLSVGSAVQAVTLANSDMSRTLPGWAAGDCTATVQSAAACSGISWASASDDERATCLGRTIYSKHVLPLFDAVGGTDPVPYAQLADDCAQSLVATSPTGVTSTAAAHCGILPVVQCGVQLAAQANLGNASIGYALNSLVDGAVSPLLLIGQERMMTALDLSKNGSGAIASEVLNYDKAAAVLNRAATWIYQPVVLEGLRKLSPTVAAGEAAGSSPPYALFPAARAISRLIRTIRDLEAERTRLNATENLASMELRRNAAQASALAAYLEGVALNNLLDTWGNAPDTVGAESSQLLGPFDTAFGAAIQGAGLFGVPDSFVPFVFDPRDAAKGKNNFEQMLNIAAAQVALYATLEDSYASASKAVMTASYELASLSTQLESQYDYRIAQLCGVDFDIDAAQSSLAVSACGLISGQVAVIRTQRDSSNLSLEASLGQLKAMRDKIAIDMRVMGEKFQLHQENLKFIDSQGTALDVLAWSEGMINTAQIVISTSSQGTLLNGFAPAALAVPMAILEFQKTALHVARQDLQTAQQMHFERQAQATEEMDAQANIEKQNIDLAQFRVHIQQSLLDQTSASLNLANGLAEAKMLLEERASAQRLKAITPANDPSYRLVRNDVAIKMLGARGRAQKYLFLASRALEYELNHPISDLAKAVLVARNAASMKFLQGCLDTIAGGHSSAQVYTRELSVRRMLGITRMREDTCTGERLSEAQQFQRVLLQNGNLDAKGGATIRFATDLMPGNGLWSSDVCGDRITAVRIQLVGDFLGDNEAQVNLALSGAAIMRDCNGTELTTWSLGADAVDGLGTEVSVIQAGVNGYGKAPANTSLYGQSVARAEWVLTIPGAAAAPTNGDLDLTKLEDIVLEVTHEARPIEQSGALGLDLSCLAQVM